MNNPPPTPRSHRMSAVGLAHKTVVVQVAVDGFVSNAITIKVDEYKPVVLARKDARCTILKIETSL